MQFSHSPQIEQEIVLEIKSNLNIFPMKSLTYLEDGISFVLRVPPPEAPQSQPCNLIGGAPHQQLVNPKEKQTTFTLSLKNLTNQVTHSQVVQQAQAQSIGTQTSSFANPRVIVDNQKLTSSNSFQDESHLLMNALKTSNSFSLDKQSSLSRILSNQKLSFDQTNVPPNLFSQQSPSVKNKSPFVSRNSYQDKILDRGSLRYEQIIQNGYEITNESQCNNIVPHVGLQRKKEGFQATPKKTQMASSLAQSALSKGVNIEQNIKEQKGHLQYSSHSSHSKFIDAQSISDIELSDNEGEARIKVQSKDQNLSEDQRMEDASKMSQNSQASCSSILHIPQAPFLKQPYTITLMMEEGKSLFPQTNQESTSVNPIQIPKQSKTITKQKEVKTFPLDTLRKKSQKSYSSFEKKKQGSRNCKYQCKFCKKKFKQCAALGGHISKAHPGQSTAYNHKKKVREQRELERQLHKDAMDYYFQKHNGKGDCQAVLNRNTLKRIKKLIVNEQDKYVVLRSKFLGMVSNSLEDIDSDSSGENESNSKDIHSQDGEEQSSFERIVVSHPKIKQEAIVEF